jgi:acyl carrier protein
MDADQLVLEELSALYRSRGEAHAVTAESSLHTLGFRSLDFAALALRIEDRVGREIDFSSAALLEDLDDVGDLQRFFRSALTA